MPWFHSVLALLCFVAAAGAGDWPQWLGPQRDASSPEVVAPWKEAPKVLWRVPVGEGHSSPVVAGGRVFVHARAKDKDEEQVRAFDAKDGKPLWEQTYPRAAFTSPFGNGPRATPCVVADRVYCFGVTGILTCYETAGGKQLWQVDTQKEFNPPKLLFGASCSPLVEGDRLLLNVGGKGASIVAFDKDKGSVLWKSLDDKASYSSPIAIGKGSQREVVFFTHKGLVSVNPTDGAPLWNYPLEDALSESSVTPVLVGDVLLASTITKGTVGVYLETKEQKPAVREAWKNPDLTCYFSTPVAVGQHTYLVTGTKPFTSTTVQADLRCIETRTGKELWKKPKVGQYHASLLRTGDNKLLLLDDAGNLMLMDPSPKEYRELCRARVCGETWVHAALANGRLYIRDKKELICLRLGE